MQRLRSEFGPHQIERWETVHIEMPLLPIDNIIQWSNTYLEESGEDQECKNLQGSFKGRAPNPKRTCT